MTAIGSYTADVYKEINSVFRDFRIDAPTANWDKYSAIAKLAISGLGKLPKAKNAISYRGDNDIKFAGHMGVLKYGVTFRLPNLSHDGKPLDAAPQSASDLTVRAFLDGNGKPRTELTAVIEAS